MSGMKSKELFEKAKTLLPGGVCSPVRAIKPYPFYVKSACGSKIETADGDELIDCCLGYGPLLLGHQNPVIKKAVSEQLERGWLYGIPTELEISLAQRITSDHPSIDMVRFVSTGAEATMSALRLARGFTEKSDIVKIEGGFHGAHDAVLIAAGSGAATHGVPDSAGVPKDFALHTRQVEYNDSDALEAMLSKNDNIAALIIEPVLGNIGTILPQKNYLEDVREITKAHDVLLIFDEVITGYRLGIGGAQVKFGIKPDLTTLGKIAGGGFPIGIFGGRRDIMKLISPEGPVYNAGTFNANPITMSAGIAVNEYLHKNKNLYDIAEKRVKRIGESINKKKTGGSFVSIGTMFKYFFRSSAPNNYREARECGTQAFLNFFKAALSQGVFFPPSQFETSFLSFAHTDEDVDKICMVCEKCL